jgi:hypothetical protein
MHTCITEVKQTYCCCSVIWRGPLLNSDFARNAGANQASQLTQYPSLKNIPVRVLACQAIRQEMYGTSQHHDELSPDLN